jgi:hypothetical protein
MRHVLALALLVPAAAYADDAAPAPAFVTLDRGDATSRVGIEASYEFANTSSIVTDGASATVLRFEAHGQYVDPGLHVGGYAMIPISYLNESEGGQSQSATGVGDAEIGGLYVPHVPVDNFGLVLRAGITLPTGSTSDNGSVANIFGSVSRLTDFYLADPKGTSLRLAVSPLWHAGIAFARADIGIDINLANGEAMTSDKLVRLNAAVGFDLGQVSVSLELVNLYDIPQATDETGADFGSQWINEGAIAGRFRSGIFEPYAAVVFPLDHDSHQFVDASLTVGLDVRLR